MEYGIYGSQCAARVSWLVNSLYVFFDCLGKSCNSATGKPASEVEKNLSRKKFSSISDELQCGDSSTGRV